MKLSCVRCKQKKLKCDRNDPCDKCTAAGAQCVANQRKQRVSHKAKDRDTIVELNSRIGLLERALQTSKPLVASPIATEDGSSEIKSPPPAVVAARLITPGRSNSGEAGSIRVEETSLGGEISAEIREAKDYSIHHLSRDGDPGSAISEAITALDGAVQGMGELDSTIISNEDPTAVLTRDEARQAVESALDITSGDFFTSVLDDRDLMKSLGDIITSPLVKIDPATRLLYYNLLFHGYLMGSQKTSTAARRLYLQCLQATPSWQESATGTMRDLAAAAIMTWTTVISFDYNLGHRFHIEACRFAKHLNLHHFDVLASPIVKDERTRDQWRAGYWQLVLTDLYFRACYGKESCLSSEASPHLCKLPAITDPSSQQPHAAPLIFTILWNRNIFIIRDFFDHYDKAVQVEGGINEPSFQKKVDELCEQVEELNEDWQIASLMRGQNKGNVLHVWGFADLLIGTNNLILQMDKLRHPTNGTVTELSTRAARAVLDTIVEFHRKTHGSHFGALYMYSIAFFPFRAFFALYYHILNSNDPDDYKEDILRLERLGSVMATAAQARFEYIPVAKAVNTLNRVAKHVQQTQTAKKASGQWNGIWPPDTPSSLDQQLLSVNPAGTTPNAQNSSDNDMIWNTQQADIAQWLPNFGNMQFASVEDFQLAAGQPSFEPLAYMKEVESQFTGRTWANQLWDVAKSNGESYIQ